MLGGGELNAMLGVIVVLGVNEADLRSTLLPTASPRSPARGIHKEALYLVVEVIYLPVKKGSSSFNFLVIGVSR